MQLEEPDLLAQALQRPGADCDDLDVEAVELLSHRVGHEELVTRRCGGNPGGRVHAQQAERYIQKMLDGVRAALPRRQVISHVTTGSPTIAIAQAAVDLGADLIAMSTHGRGGLARAVLGSTATATLERSIVPLLLVGPAAVTASLSVSEKIATPSLSGPSRKFRGRSSNLDKSGSWLAQQ